MTIGDLSGVLAVVMKIPMGWVWAMVVLAVLSCVSISHPPDGGVGVTFSVGATTVGVIALIWLPALLRLLVLTGGRVRAAGVEASSEGLLKSELIERLTNIRTATEEAGRQAPEAEERLKGVAVQVDQMAAEFLSGASPITDEDVRRLALEYEQIRASMESGDERTVAMTRVVNEARVRAAGDPAEARQLGRVLIRADRQGERIVGLAFTQEAPTRQAFDDVLALVLQSETAFEMYHALLALEQLAPQLTHKERKQAIDGLLKEKKDPRGVGVMQDNYLPALIDHNLSVLTEESKSV